MALLPALCRHIQRNNTAQELRLKLFGDSTALWIDVKIIQRIGIIQPFRAVYHRPAHNGYHTAVRFDPGIGLHEDGSHRELQLDFVSGIYRDRVPACFYTLPIDLGCLAPSRNAELQLLICSLLDQNGCGFFPGIIGTHFHVQGII